MVNRLLVSLARKKPSQKENQEVLKRGVAHLGVVPPLPVEGLREPPAGVHPCRGAQAPGRVASHTSPSWNAPSALSAALTPSRKTMLCSLVLAEPQNGRILGTIWGWLTAHW